MICPGELANDLSAWRAAVGATMRSMVAYTKAAVERAMQVQEGILRAMAKRLTWWQAAEILGKK
jgi:hypothetical protein